VCASRILVVDDEPNVRRLIKDALSMQGHTIEEAVDGVEAAKLLRGGGFDIVLTDIQMPRMDGKRLAELARQIVPDIGIIIVTAFPSDASILATFRSGAAAYLLKPVDLYDLFRAVREVERERTELAEKLAGRAGGGAQVRLESPRPGWVEFEAPSHHLYIERFANFFELLLRRGVDEDVLNDVRVAMQELGATAVAWGNAGDPRRPVRISALVEPDQLVLVIEDQGVGFIPGSVPDPKADPVGVAERRRASGKRAGGYGIAMARAAMDEIYYNKAGNTVVMTKHLTRKGEGKADDAQTSASQGAPDPQEEEPPGS
jgi:CheY-like chemotaxis protein